MATAVVKLEAAQAALRIGFLGWQCRLRQMAVRQAGGRPTSGMRPDLLLDDGGRAPGPITVLIVKADPEEATDQFRHMARRTHDPAERYKAAQKFLAAAYYQGAADFSDELTALFGPGSETVLRLLSAGRCRLRFEQYAQSYLLPCRVREHNPGAPLFEATYWHNSLYNTSLPAGVQVIGFQPDWSEAEADPPL
ncbi:MAG: hypothetical protein QNJ67_15895 [Kiloniellales bacterium]|nr:hypothetical protein [Kiloniellales bacterium]